MKTKNPKMNESVTTLSHVLSNGTEIVIERTLLTPERPKIPSTLPLGDDVSPGETARGLLAVLGTVADREDLRPRDYYAVTLKQRGVNGKVVETKFSLGPEETKEFLGLFSMLQGAHVIGGCFGR